MTACRSRVSRATPFTWALTEAQIFQALAAEVEVDGAMVANPYKKWSDIDAALPDAAILAYRPAADLGHPRRLRRAGRCMTAASSSPSSRRCEDRCDEDRKFITESCSRMRQDGPFVEAGENDNLIVQRLEADPNALGIFGYSFLLREPRQAAGRRDRRRRRRTRKPSPTVSYGVARPLYFYIKNAHRGVIPGLERIRHRIRLGGRAGRRRLSAGTRPDRARRRRAEREVQRRSRAAERAAELRPIQVAAACRQAATAAAPTLPTPPVRQPPFRTLIRAVR